MPLFTFRTGVTLLAVAATILPSHAQLYNKTIMTESGPAQGFKYFNQTTLQRFYNTSDSNVAAFLGIPYAADTGYQNRWKPPKPREPWNETFMAVGLP